MMFYWTHRGWAFPVRLLFGWWAIQSLAVIGTLATIQHAARIGAWPATPDVVMSVPGVLFFCRWLYIAARTIVRIYTSTRKSWM